MVLRPTNVSTITKAVQSLLLADADLGDVTVERSEELNAIPSVCPWVGIYRVAIQYPSRVLGFGPGMRDQRVQLLLLIQHANLKSGADCEDELETLVQRVLAALLSDTTLGGAVATLDDIEVQYPDYQRTAEDGYMQTAALYITAIGGIQ